MMGPVARLSKKIHSYEEPSDLSPEEIKKQDIFPYKPLAHPIQNTAHMLFPDSWIKVHPEHERMDCGIDIPDNYLPEYPPPMFLTTNMDMSYVTNVREETLVN